MQYTAQYADNTETTLVKFSQKPKLTDHNRKDDAYRTKCRHAYLKKCCHARPTEPV